MESVVLIKDTHFDHLIPTKYLRKYFLLLRYKKFPRFAVTWNNGEDPDDLLRYAIPEARTCWNYGFYDPPLKLDGIFILVENPQSSNYEVVTWDTIGFLQ